MAAVRIDQPDEEGGWSDDADTPDAPDAEGAAGSRDGDRERVAPAALTGPADSGGSAASAGEHEAYRTRVDAVFRAHAIDQAYDRVREIERGIVTPAMKRIESEDPERRLAGLEHSLKGQDRLTEKVDNWMSAQANLTAVDAIRLVKDAIRYTFVYEETTYSADVQMDAA